MPSRKGRGGDRSSLVRTRAGNKVKSHSEAVIDNWLHKQWYDFVYEPEVHLVEEVFHPDWIVYGRKGISLRKPIIIEYWGLLRRGTRASWVSSRLPKYKARKEYKEKVYDNAMEYDFIGILPDYLSQLPKFLGRPLKESFNAGQEICKFYQVQCRYPAQSVLLFAGHPSKDHTRST